MVLLLIWALFFLESVIEPCFCSAPSLNSPMVDPCGSCRCGLIHTFQASLLNFTLPKSHGLTGKLGCTPGILEKSSAFLLSSNFSATLQGSGCLNILCLLGLKGMALKILRASQTKASLGAMLHGVPASNRGNW